IDLDGDIDIVVGNDGSPNEVFINSGKGLLWQKTVLANESFDTYDIITSDLNKDGLPDIIEGNSDEINRFYINQKKQIILKQ
ncbi:MAG: VCBS repeat-containing protein, partial [Croceitalea sp.]|nr:VCBS repeat-containing protein [Croceitalea sp.]